MCILNEITENCVYVRGFPSDINEDGIRKFLEPHEVLSVKFVNNHYNRMSTIVSFESPNSIFDVQSAKIYKSYKKHRIEIRPLNREMALQLNNQRLEEDAKQRLKDNLQHKHRGVYTFGKTHYSSVRNEQTSSSINKASKVNDLTNFAIYITDLSSSVTKADIMDFFEPNLPVGIKFSPITDGRLSNNVTIYFETAGMLGEAMKPNFKLLGGRYVKLQCFGQQSGVGSEGGNHVLRWPTTKPKAIEATLNNKSFVGRLLFGMRTPSGDDFRRMHSCAATQQQLSPRIINLTRTAATLARRLVKM